MDIFRKLSIFSLFVTYLLSSSNVISAVRIDYYLHAEYPPLAIVVGEIFEINVDPQESSFGQRQETFLFKINQVLWGAQELESRILKFKYATLGTQIFEPAIPYKVGTFCILIVKHQSDGFYWLDIALPALQKNFEKISNLEDTKDFIVKNLLDALTRSNSIQEKIHLVTLVGPLLNPKESVALVPYVDSPDLFLRRAAVAGLLHATKDAKYLSIVLKDVSSYLLKASIENTGIESLENEGFFIVDDDYAKNIILLPIFRLIAKNQNPKMSESLKEKYILLLGMPDNIEDLPLIYSFYMNVRNQSFSLQKNGSYKHDSMDRLHLLRSMAVILRLSIGEINLNNDIESLTRQEGYEEIWFPLIQKEIIKRGIKISEISETL